MNTTKKLKELGFSKVGFYAPNPSHDGDAMLPCEIKESKIHTKQDSHWKLVFNEQYIIWIFIKSNVIDIIYLQDNFNTCRSTYGFSNLTYSYSLRSDLIELYNFSGSLGTINKIVSKKQIINLLPLSIKREFIIRDLLK